MPWKSDAQREWGHSKAGKKELGPRRVKEFDRKTKGKKLPAKKGRRGA